MFQRALTASSRAVSSSSRTIAQRPLVRSKFSPASVRVSLSTRTRWYSDQADAATKKSSEGETQEADAGAEAKESKEAPAPSNAEAELQKKLETKEKEAIDWKVRANIVMPHTIARLPSLGGG